MEGLIGECLVGQAFVHRAQPGMVLARDMGPSSIGTTSAGGVLQVRCNVVCLADKCGNLGGPQLLKLAVGTWIVTSLEGKEHGLVKEAESY